MVHRVPRSQVNNVVVRARLTDVVIGLSSKKLLDDFDLLHRANKCELQGSETLELWLKWTTLGS